MISPDNIDLPDALTSPLGGWKYETVGCRLEELLTEFPRQAHRTTIGRSAEGRPIQMIRLGQGETRVLAWSQMHGDEHTYTTVLLNLIRLLASRPDHPLSASILKRCQLQLIVMLNPDGAQRGSRFNAQGADVNRDALSLATPEGRVLNQTVGDLRPDFAFNLHNQNHRRWLPSGEGPIALSLLVPPVDAENTATPGTSAARQVAASICRSVRPRCAGRVSRYPADYMPRCFGEWVQGQGAATVLLEAGGWDEEDIRELERLNLLALVSGLATIAEPELADGQPTAYDELPIAADHEAFDLLIEGPRVMHNFAIEATQPDIGINRPHVTAMAIQPGTGVIMDLGDLSLHASFQRIDGQGQLCLPGKIGVSDQPVGPDAPPSDALLEEAVRHGLTTLLLPVDSQSRDTLAWIRSVLAGPQPLLNIGFMGQPCDLADPSSSAAQSDLLLGVMRHNGEHTEDWRANVSTQRWIELNNRFAKLWSLSEYHKIDRGVSANLALVPEPADQYLPVGEPHTVIIGGSVVLRDGQIVERHAGAWLHRESRVVARR